LYKRIALWAAGLAVALVAIGGTAFASQNSTPNPVIVQNTATSPVPVSGNVGVTGTVGIGSANNHVRVDNLPTTYPVTGSVSLSGALPAGTNNIGSVSIARGVPYANEESNQLSNSDAVIAIANRAGTTTGVQLESVSIEAILPAGEVLERCYVESDPTFVAMFVPMTKQGSDGSLDYYDGTVAIQLNAPAGENLVGVCNRPPNPNNGPMSIFVSFSGEETPS